MEWNARLENGPLGTDTKGNTSGWNAQVVVAGERGVADPTASRHGSHVYTGKPSAHDRSRALGN